MSPTEKFFATIIIAFLTWLLAVGTYDVVSKANFRQSMTKNSCKLLLGEEQ